MKKWNKNKPKEHERNIKNGMFGRSARAEKKLRCARDPEGPPRGARLNWARKLDPWRKAQAMCFKAKEEAKGDLDRLQASWEKIPPPPPLSPHLPLPKNKREKRRKKRKREKQKRTAVRREGEGRGRGERGQTQTQNLFEVWGEGGQGPPPPGTCSLGSNFFWVWAPPHYF